MDTMAKALLVTYGFKLKVYVTDEAYDNHTTDLKDALLDALVSDIQDGWITQDECTIVMEPITDIQFDEIGTLAPPWEIS